MFYGLLCIAAQVLVIINSDSDDNLQFGPPWSPSNPILPVTINEEIPIGSKITTLIASDPETGELIKNFREVEGTDPQNYFSVNPTTGWFHPFVFIAISLLIMFLLQCR